MCRLRKHQAQQLQIHAAATPAPSTGNSSYANSPLHLQLAHAQQGVSSGSGLLPPTSTPESADDEVSDDEDGGNEATAFKRRFFQQQEHRRRSNTADSSLRNHHHNVPSVLHRQVMFILTHFTNIISENHTI